LRMRLSAIRSTANARDQLPGSNNLFRKHRDYPLRRTVQSARFYRDRTMTDGVAFAGPMQLPRIVFRR
jgi:hypothetical protein